MLGSAMDPLDNFWLTEINPRLWVFLVRSIDAS
jgi:hypothetical protein